MTVQIIFPEKKIISYRSNPKNNRKFEKNVQKAGIKAFNKVAMQAVETTISYLKNSYELEADRSSLFFG